MSLLMVRHADAGDRAAWTGDDRRRPLSATGRRQSEALVEQYEGRDLQRILSSPARRCTDTVEPVAVVRGLEVEEHEALAEGAPFDQIDALLRELADTDALLCSHADVIGSIVTALRHREVNLGNAPSARKAATWIVDTWPDAGRVELLPTPDPA
jgi:phosphohistidine phosphatase SixA